MLKFGTPVVQSHIVNCKSCSTYFNDRCSHLLHSDEQSARLITDAQLILSLSCQNISSPHINLGGGGRGGGVYIVLSGEIR